MIFRYTPSINQHDKETTCPSCGNTVTRYSLPSVAQYRIDGLPAEHEHQYLLGCFEYCEHCGKFTVACAHLGERNGMLRPHLSRMDAAHRIIEEYAAPLYKDYILGRLHQFCNTGLENIYLQKFIDQYNNTPKNFTDTDALLVVDLYRKNNDMKQAQKICKQRRISKNNTAYELYQLVLAAIRSQNTGELIVPSCNYLYRF